MFFLFLNPLSFTCLFLSRRRGRKGSVGMKRETFPGRLSHGKQLNCTKKKMNNIPPQIQAFLRGGLGKKFHFEHGMRLSLVQLKGWLMEAEGMRWKGLGALKQRRAIYLQIIRLRWGKSGEGMGQSLVQVRAGSWSLLFWLHVAALPNRDLDHVLIESCHWIFFF